MYESEGILIEAANRQKEWGEVYGHLPDSEEILVVANIENMPDGPLRTILELANHQTLQQVMYNSYYGEFDTARMLSSLFFEQRIRLLSNEELQSLSAEYEAKEEWERAIHYYQVLIKRNPSDFNTCEALANSYEKAGQKENLALLYQTVAQHLLSSPKRAERTQGALCLKKFAALAGDSNEGVEARIQLFGLVFRQLIDSTSIDYHPIKEGNLLYTMLRKRKEDVDARRVLENLLLISPHDTALQSKFINVCLDLGDVASAVGQYEDKAKVYERDKNWKELIACYQKIIKLDPQRKDIAQKLEILEARATGALVLGGRKFSWILILLILAGVGFYGYQKFIKRISPQKEYPGTSRKASF